MKIEVKDQELKRATYHLQITDVVLFHSYLKEEDEILSFNRNTKIFQSSKILKLEKSMHDNFIKYKVVTMTEVFT